jgi:hypothetical protein
MKGAITLLVLAVMGALGGCGDAAPMGCPPNGTTLTYSNFGAPFMAKHCTSCHGNTKPAAGVFLTSPGAIRQHQFSVDESAGAGSTMPPSNGPTSAERARLTEWLACGAPEAPSVDFPPTRQ